MSVSATLSRYMARSYFVNMLFLLFALLGVVYLFDTVELIRRASKYEDVSLILVLQMGLLKLPEVGQILFPFAILFSAMFTFWQLTKRYELIVVRAAGFSVWQFLAPVLMVALIIGFFQIMVINPMGAVFLKKFEELENTYLNREDRHVAIFKDGLWIRQSTDQGYMILHAEEVEQPAWILKNVMVLFFEAGDRYTERIDSLEAQLIDGRWVLEDVLRTRNNQQNRFSRLEIPTSFTIADVEESFSSPETLSFWRLPSHIHTLEETGFDASRLKVHYHNLLAQPLMFISMVLIAAAVSMRPPRSGHVFFLSVIGILCGFLIFFLSSFLQAMGASGQMPVLLSAWAPAFISFLLGLTALLSLEDG